MKKYLSVLLAFIILSLCSCTRKNEKEETTGTTQTETSVFETEAVPLDTPPVSIITTTSFSETETTTGYENPIVKTAEALIGIDFAEGGASPSEGFDNSGFIYYVLRENGYIGCPRQISSQINWGENAGYEELKPGDIAYFSEEIGGAASFGGVYAGGGVIIYSPYPGEKVKKADITKKYWQERFVTALSL